MYTGIIDEGNVLCYVKLFFVLITLLIELRTAYLVNISSYILSFCYLVNNFIH